ncbi:MAG: hypothetical protein K0S65_2305 [Labilithrix sp.]|nr:hypothetical protein [Labilithrix sp.]
MDEPLTDPDDDEFEDELDYLGGTTSIAYHPELARAIHEDPDSIANHLVYADWLTEQGDPRGELIACMAPGASRAAQRRAAKLLKQHHKYFYGNIAYRREAFVQLEWELGWIAGARVAPAPDDVTLWRDSVELVHRALADHVIETALRGLLDLSSAQFIKRLTLGCFTVGAEEHDYNKLYPILVTAGPRPTMRRLFIGDTVSEEQELSWTSAGELARIRGLYPNLRQLRIRAGAMVLEGGLDYPKLEALVIESGGMSRESVRAVAETSFPMLHQLELWTGSSDYGATSSLDDILPILDGVSFPALVRLGLCNSEYADDIAQALARSPIAERLEDLDLSKGIMTDAGAEALLSARSRFARLRRLDVSDNYLSDDAIDALDNLGAYVEILADDQKEDEGDERYVSVGE